MRQALYVFVLGTALASAGEQESTPSTTDQPIMEHAHFELAEVSPSSRSSLSLELGGAKGFAILGSTQEHDLALMSLAYGYRVGEPIMGGDTWHRGFWEVRFEFFGGAQFVPSVDWLIGLTPHLRYTFMTGTPWWPFLDVGAGVSATGISEPDLSGIFEFNEQVGLGIHYFFANHMACTFETKFMHMSCARISRPNLGLNAVMGFIGVTWFF
jgi:hypothetical protein